MTKMAGIFKAAMEIIDSLFIRILDYKKQNKTKTVYKHRHIRRILASSQNHQACNAWTRK